MTQNPVLSCIDLNLKNAYMSIQGIRFQAYPGEWVEVVGKARSGKTLLFDLFTLRFIIPKAPLKIHNKQPDLLSSAEVAELRRRIGSCAQQPIFLEDRTVMENLVLPSIARNKKIDADLRAEELLQELAIEKFESRASKFLTLKMKHLSYQDRTLVGIMRALMDDPELIIIDVGFENISVAWQENIFAALNRRVNEMGTTLVLFSSYPLNAYKGGKTKTFDLPNPSFLENDF